MWKLCSCCWGKETEKTQHQHQQALLILRNNDDDYDNGDHDHDPTTTIASAAMVLTSWLRSSRRRYLLLALFSPLLLPFLCATFPLLCAVEVCLCLCRLGQRSRRRRRRRSLLKSTAPADDHGGDGLRLCEEGRGESEGDEVRLLQRYLEDQLLLVLGSVYDCGGDDDDEGDDSVGELSEKDGDDVKLYDSRGPLLP